MHRRQTTAEHVDKRGDSPGSPSPLRRNIELDGTLSHRSQDRRTTVSGIKATSAASKPVAENQTLLRRRASSTDTRSLNASFSTTSSRPGNIERHNTISSSRPQVKRSSLDIDFAAMSVSGSSSSGSSDGGDSHSHSGSEGTVTSDGGFTDYLSDESEAELQRQAEAKAALLAQNHMEEQEFRAARQQLANVDLRPPKSWNPGPAATHATPRSQNPVSPTYSSTIPTSYATPRGQVDAVGIGRSR